MTQITFEGKMAIKILSVFLLVHFIAFAQDVKVIDPPVGRILGKIIDVDTGEPLGQANVAVDGTNLGVEANKDGSYLIEGVAPGLYKVRTSYIGYYQQTKDSVRVLATQTTQLSFLLINEYPDSIIWVSRANKDIANNNVRILIYGDIVTTGKTISDSLMAIVTKTYGFHYEFGNYPCKGCSIYNEVINRYLDKLNGANWRQKFAQDSNKFRK